MRSGKNRVTKQEIEGVLEIKGVVVNPGDWIVGDANGCVAIPRDQLDEVLRRAESIERTESKIRAAIALYQLGVEKIEFLVDQLPSSNAAQTRLILDTLDGNPLALDKVQQRLDAPSTVADRLPFVFAEMNL